MLTSISLENFKTFKGKTVIGLGTSVTCIVGHNGCGKSNLADAVCFALGMERATLRLEGKDIHGVISTGETKAHVEVTLNGLKIARSVTRNTKKCKYTIDSAVIPSKVKFHAALESRLGLSLTCPMRFLLTQQNTTKLVNSPPESNLHLLDELCGTDVVLRRLSELNEKIAAKKSLSCDLTSKLSVLEARKTESRATFESFAALQTCTTEHNVLEELHEGCLAAYFELQIIRKTEEMRRAVSEGESVEEQIVEMQSAMENMERNLTCQRRSAASARQAAAKDLQKQKYLEKKIRSSQALEKKETQQLEAWTDLLNTASYDIDRKIAQKKMLEKNLNTTTVRAEPTDKQILLAAHHKKLRKLRLEVETVDIALPALQKDLLRKEKTRDDAEHRVITLTQTETPAIQTPVVQTEQTREILAEKLRGCSWAKPPVTINNESHVDAIQAVLCDEVITVSVGSLKFQHPIYSECSRAKMCVRVSVRTFAHVDLVKKPTKRKLLKGSVEHPCYILHGDDTDLTEAIDLFRYYQKPVAVQGGTIIVATEGEYFAVPSPTRKKQVGTNNKNIKKTDLTSLAESELAWTNAVASCSGTSAEIDRLKTKRDSIHSSISRTAEAIENLTRTGVELTRDMEEAVETMHTIQKITELETGVAYQSALRRETENLIQNSRCTLGTLQSNLSNTRSMCRERRANVKQHQKTANEYSDRADELAKCHAHAMAEMSRHLALLETHMETGKRFESELQHLKKNRPKNPKVKISTKNETSLELRLANIKQDITVKKVVLKKLLGQLEGKMEAAVDVLRSLENLEEEITATDTEIDMLEKQRNVLVNDRSSKLTKTVQALNNELESLCGSELCLSLSLLPHGVHLLARAEGSPWRPLTTFSGGQRAFLSILFSLSLCNVFPTPFILFDEADAALDCNYSDQLSLLLTRATRAMVLCVTLRENIYKHAGRLVGIHRKDGWSKVVTQVF